MGWIDLQINGFGGIDFNSPGLTGEMVAAATAALTERGTEAYMPTLLSTDPAVLEKNLATIAAERKRNAAVEKAIIGIFMEGTFISPEPGAVGTHDLRWVRTPDLKLFGRYQDACGGLIRMVNVAAELEGAPQFIRSVREQGVTVALGHQMAHTPAELEPAIEAGASAYTHLGNGLPNMIHRRENVIWEALADDRMSVMFIPDGHHLTLSMLKVFCRAVPAKRLVAVSDAQFPAGMPPGEYVVSGEHARLEPSGLLWNPARNCLVGATTPMADMMSLLSEKIGLTPDECRLVGHDNPLELIGGTK